jgi:tellurite resistance protein TerC
MHWFWLGFFALVALLLFLDLGVLHRKNEEQSLNTAAMWTVGWTMLGLSFSGIVYLIYQNHWLGADIKETPVGTPDGASAAITYVSAYLLEQALSIDNIFVIALTFAKFRVPAQYQHRVLFWGILGAVVFRVAMLGGGVWLATKFDWIFYLFGGYLAFQGGKMLKEFLEGLMGGHDDDDEDEDGVETMWLIRKLRRWFMVVDGVNGEHAGKLLVRINGRRALTTVFVCLIAVELTDVVFALDSIPAVLSVSQETFIIVTSNIFAILGLRSLYFVLAGAMAKFKFLELALGVLLVGIGVKMILHSHVHIGHVASLIAIAGILSAGVIASLIDMKRNPEPAPTSPDANGPGPASPSP